MKTNYGQFIYNKKRLLKLTEGKLAEYTDMSVRHLRNIEKGITMPKLDTIIKLGDALNKIYIKICERTILSQINSQIFFMPVE